MFMNKSRPEASGTVQNASTMPRVRVFDTTLRDGEQSPGVQISSTQKVEIARKLEDFGVETIEAGYPASSPGDMNAVKAVSRAVNCEVAALARCVIGDIDAAVEALSSPSSRRCS